MTNIEFCLGNSEGEHMILPVQNKNIRVKVDDSFDTWVKHMSQVEPCIIKRLLHEQAPKTSNSINQ